MPASLPSDSAASANGRLGRGARTQTPVHGMQRNRHTEFLLSDHHEARRLRLLGRLRAAAADPAQLDRWWQHLAGGVPLPDADRYRLEELRADGLTVVLARRRFEQPSGCWTTATRTSPPARPPPSSRTCSPPTWLSLPRRTSPWDRLTRSQPP